MPPAYVVQHTYLREGAQMQHRRPVLLMTNPIGNESREADCSGRALATLVVAWVGAALVASVLLKWTHMWVALAVLTLLFLVACGYAACDARRTQIRALARETERQEERRRRREHLESVSGGIDNFPEIINPPEYQTYWVADLPPSYTTAVGTQTVNGDVVTPSQTEETPSTNSPRLSNPPPYAIAIQAEPLFLPIIQNSNQNEAIASELPISVSNSGVDQSNENGQTSSQTGRIARLPIAIRDQDKIEEGGENDQNTLTTQPTRTQYLAAILNSTFGRNVRRTNVPELNNNSTPAGGQANDNHNNRNRDQILVHNSNNNNNERNTNNNHGAGPPPQY